MLLSVGFLLGVFRYIDAPLCLGLICLFAKQNSSLVAEICRNSIANTYAWDYPKYIFECVKYGKQAVVFIADLAVLFKHLPR